MMKNSAILILAVWSCAEWGRVDGSSHPTSGKKFQVPVIFSRCDLADKSK
jgi:hypothetical protein